MIFKKSHLFLSSILLVSALVWACADWYSEYFSYSNITPETLVQKKYEPFFYNESSFYYSYNHSSIMTYSFMDINVNEWNSYLENKVSKDHIKDLLSSDNYKYLAVVEKISKGKPLDTKDSFTDKKMIPLYTTKRFRNFIEYVNISNATNSFSLNENSPWSEPKRYLPVNKDKLLSELTNKYQSIDSSDQFLKNKYALQLIRYYFYTNPSRCEKFYNSIASSLNKDATSARIISYMAGAYYKSKEYAKSNYFYSKAYTINDDIKISANYSFHPQSNADWNQCLSLAKNNDEKIVLWHLLGYYFDEARAIDEIIKLNPNSEYLDLLLVRYINKIESKYNYSSENNALNQGVAKDSIKLFQTIVSNSLNPNASNPFLWNIASGYLYWLTRDHKNADIYYEKAKKYISTSDLGKKKQWIILSTLNKMASAEKITPEIENEWANQMLYIKEDTSQNDIFRTQFAIRFFQNKLYSLYAKMGDSTKMQCLSPQDSFYIDNSKIDKLISYINNPKKPIDKVVLSYFSLNSSHLIYYKGIKALYSENFLQAKEILNTIPKDTTYLLANPFNGFIKDCHDCEFMAPQKRTYTSSYLINTMSDINDSIRSNNNLYLNSLLMANAYYNISFYGNARVFFAHGVISDFLVTPDDIGFPFRKMVLSMDKAKKYYQLALDNATTPEQKAKCTYMLSKCERNEYYNASFKYFEYKPIFEDSYWGKIKWVYSGAYFKKLHAEFSTTKFYKEVLKECSYFDLYVKKH